MSRILGENYLGIDGMRWISASSEIVLQRHPELYHYTTVAGFRGIIESRSIWGTEYKTLNDSTEIRYSQEALAAPLSRHLKKSLQSKRFARASVRRRIEAAGDLHLVARRLAEAVLATLHDAAFEAHEEASCIVPAMATPYITSFCSHALDDEYTAANGLLSQWRGYGGDGGLCIVFDTMGLLQLLEAESQKYFFAYLNLNEALYFDPANWLEDFASELFHQCDEVAEFLVRNELGSPPRQFRQDDPSESFVRYVALAARIKHRAFREEREVRVISCPMNEMAPETYVEEFRTSFAAAKAALPAMHFKPSRIGLSNKRYIALFEGQSAPLPIKRVVVGPSRIQSKTAYVARQLLPGIPVTLSETPFTP
jgi:hypothetical protein